MFSFAVGALSCVTQFWFSMVSTVVPEPHLDEVFHIHQAQAYCQDRWDVWDPKLTTPPGLYLISYYFSRTFFLECTIPFLRAQNAIINCLLLPYVVLRICRHLHRESEAASGSASIKRYATWTAINVSLFPILFFFSALYYTDVASTFWVLVTYLLFLERWEQTSSFYLPNWFMLRGVAILASGLISLSFRQTNILWVAVFLGGLEFLQVVKSRDEAVSAEERKLLQVTPTYTNIVVHGWTYGQIYDPPVSDASLDDYLKTALSLAISALPILPPILLYLQPYFALIGSFLAFIIWNGGVVLGDKSNHVATLHLPQLLYIWPFFAFFSFPQLYPFVTSLLLPPSRLPSFLRITPPTTPFSRIRPRALVFLTTLLLALLAIHYNTIVHPFTLADNRHYTFYIFRRILLRHPLSKYLFAPSYLLLGWAAVRTLGGVQPDADHGVATMAAGREWIDETKRVRIQEPMLGSDAQGRTASWVLLWLGTVAGVLGTVPLVEPRYLIIPWVVWRVNLPLRGQLGARQWWGLAAETLWFLAVNLVTGYVFLYKGFEWESEKGAVQRFMW